LRARGRVRAFFARRGRAWARAFRRGAFATGRGFAAGAGSAAARTGATGAGAGAGSRGGGDDSRGQSTTSATAAGSTSSRARFPQRTRRSSESGGMTRVGGGPGRFAPCYRGPPFMAAPAPIYDLVVMLDTAAPDDQRAKILADVEAMISGAADVVSKHDWGPRALAYEIRHKTDAEYHLIQFHATPELLASLQRTLRITDGVMRYRIIKLEPGTPDPPARPERAPIESAEAPTPA
jgi:small subunit ribosomal protein S6